MLSMKFAGLCYVTVMKKSHTAYPQYGFRLWLTTHKIFLIVKALMLIKSRRITLLLLEVSGEKLYRSSVF